MSWQSIDWAKPPKGQVILYWPAHGTSRGRAGYTLAPMIRVDYAEATPNRKPTHWMPLPAPPTE